MKQPAIVKVNTHPYESGHVAYQIQKEDSPLRKAPINILQLLQTVFPQSKQRRKCADKCPFVLEKCSAWSYWDKGPCDPKCPHLPAREMTSSDCESQHPSMRVRSRRIPNSEGGLSSEESAYKHPSAFANSVPSKQTGTRGRG
ncbi:hypothetical protein CDAR_57521 [Caerostris darwini]|uniref:Uncharacterized protein n=1 Tax=Caerostris darwini TaxID=1538125 RepID=A0AAV4SZM7_9ARAC|nr:hypothetical protein CDAR_57521 [Caerostris darwini]